MLVFLIEYFIPLFSQLVQRLETLNLNSFLKCFLDWRGGIQTSQSVFSNILIILLGDKFI